MTKRLFIFWLFVINCLFLPVSQGANSLVAANKFKRSVFLVPVYRELYSQNIGAVLEALYNQDLTGLPFKTLDVWFVVNNTVDASEDVRTENQETVAFLKSLAEGKAPSIRPQHEMLRSLVDKNVSDKLKIHVLDLTTPGRPERNIGAIRDLGFKSILQAIPKSEYGSTLIYHMDADTSFDPKFTLNVVRAMEHGDLKFALNKLYYGDQPESELRVYQRKIVTDYHAAAYEFNLVANADMPYGGGPRIVTTAQALLDVGGVPHEVVGEDVALVKLLRARFKNQGRYIDNTAMAKYRAREDGYDAKIYLGQLDHPIEFSEWDLKVTQSLDEAILPEIQKGWLQSALYKEAFEAELKEYSLNVQRLRSLVTVLILDKHLGTTTFKPGAHIPGIMNNSWFFPLIQKKVAEHGADVSVILADLTKMFPYYFSDPPMEAIVKIAQLKAATKVLLHKPYFNPKFDLAYLASIRHEFPKSIPWAIFDSFNSRWAAWKARGVADAEMLTAFRDELQNLVQNLALFPEATNTEKDRLHEVAVALVSDLYGTPARSEDELKKYKDLIQFSGVKRIPQYLLNRRNQAITDFQNVLKKTEHFLRPDADGKWQCLGCLNFHLTSRTTYDGPYLSLTFLKDLQKDLETSFSIKSTDPLTLEFFKPLLELYQKAMDTKIDKIVETSDLATFGKFKDQFRIAQPRCAELFLQK